MSMGYWLGHVDECAEPLTGYDVRFDDCRAGLVGVVDRCVSLSLPLTPR